MFRIISKTIINLQKQQTYCFSKKVDNKKKSPEYGIPLIKPKKQQDYIRAPEQIKKSVIQVKNMQTASQAQFQQQELRKVIITERENLKKSLKQEISQQSKKPQNSKFFWKNSQAIQQHKYYLTRPLKYLERMSFFLLSMNVFPYMFFQLALLHNNIGWYYGLFTFPATIFTIATLIGYNFAFWIVRHHFHMHLLPQDLSKKKISMVSSSFGHLSQLLINVGQLGIFGWIYLFNTQYQLYHFYGLIYTFSIFTLSFSLKQLLYNQKISPMPYMTDYVRMLSTLTILMSCFIFYSMQIKAGKNPHNTIDSQDYRKRTQQIYKGYKQFTEAFIEKKYIMKEDEKINKFQQQNKQ